MNKITLASLLQYYDQEDEPIDRMQIATSDQDWDSAAELCVDSDLVLPFMRWYVSDMRIERSYIDGSPIIRVMIAP